MASYLLTGPFLVLDLLLQGTFAALCVVPLATHLLRDLLELLLQRRALWGGSNMDNVPSACRSDTF